MALSVSRQWLTGSLLLAVITCLAYAPAIGAGYIWDDDQYVTENLTLRSLPGLWQIWFEIGAVPQYYPVTHTTFWLEYHLWGLHPAGFHLVNIALHITVALLVWQMLRRWNVPGAWLAAAIFAVHPVHVESVAWITERKNVLSGVACLTTLWLLWDIFDSPSPSRPEGEAVATDARFPLGRYLAALVVFVLGLLSKSVIATLPAAVLVLQWWRTGRVDRMVVVRLLPFFAVALGLGLHTAAMERGFVGASGIEFSWTPAERLIIAGRAPWFYLGKLLWPHPICFNYPRWNIDASQLLQFLWPAATAALLVGLVAVQRRWGRGPLAAILFFGGSLFPVLGFLNVFPFRFAYVADHFQYLASLGPIVLVAALLARGSSRWLPARTKSVQFVQVAGCAALLLALGTLTFRQCHAYENAQTLWEDTLAKNPSSWLALSNLGDLLADRGDSAAAYPLFQRAHQIYPLAPEPRANVIRCLIQLRRLDEAAQLLEESLAIAPEHEMLWECHLRLARTRAQQHEDAGELSAAVQVLAQSLQELPALRNAGAVGDVYGDYGRLLFMSGDLPAARRELQRAVELAPESADHRTNYGTVLAASGSLDAARREFEVALQLSPDDGRVYVNVARCELLAGRADQAVAWLTKAYQIAQSTNDKHLLAAVQQVLDQLNATQPLR